MIEQLKNLMDKDPTFAGEQTLESFVERAFIGLMTQTNPGRFLELLESGEVAQHTVDIILRSINVDGLRRDITFPKEEIYPFIDQIIDEYDGFDYRMMFSTRLSALVNEFPLLATWQAIQDRKPQMVAKIHRITRFLVEKKRRQHESNGMKRFIQEVGGNVPHLDGLNDDVAIDRILKYKRDELELVLCGDGSRYEVFRVKARNPEVEWDHTGLLVKSMKRVRGGDEAQDAVFGVTQKEHQAVAAAFQGKRISTPETVFMPPHAQRLRDIYHGLGTHLVFQSHVVGEPLSVAQKDPAMRTELGRSVRDLVISYEKMRADLKKVLDCKHLESEGILATRTMDRTGGSRVNLKIVSTNNLIPNKPTDSNNYLDQLRALMT